MIQYIPSRGHRQGLPGHKMRVGEGKTITETLALLTLLAVVIFGVIEAMKEK